MIGLLNDLIILDCEQGSDEWLRARMGIPTGTGIGRIVSPTGKISKEVGYLAELLAETQIDISSTPSFKSKAMERGNELEPLARERYEFETGNMVTEVGGVYLNENLEIMVSPDGLIPDQHKGLEIKCPDMKTHIKYTLENVLPYEYVIQVMSNLWVTGYDSWDFVSYCPEFEPAPFFMLTIKRDEKLISQINNGCMTFIKRLNALKAQFQIT